MVLCGWFVGRCHSLLDYHVMHKFGFDDCHYNALGLHGIVYIDDQLDLFDGAKSEEEASRFGFSLFNIRFDSLFGSSHLF